MARAQPSTVLPPPTLLLGQMLPVSSRLAARSSTVLPPPTLLLGQKLPVFCIRLVCKPLLSDPPLHYCWGRCCTFFIRLVRGPMIFYPLPTPLLGRMLPGISTVDCAILYCATPPYTTTVAGADAARFFCRRRFGRPFTVLPPYTTPRINAACFGATSVGVLGDPSLC